MTVPSAITEIEHLWIPANGIRLAARAWLPPRPAPAVVEYIPYGKRWGTRSRDEVLHRRLAELGLACLRVDVRGTGESDGVMDDEYSEAELADGEALIAWAAAQPWCNGHVYLIGKSWGGFNALQLAARRPPTLAGVVSACASDDRYDTDAHYMGGCTLVENHVYGSLLFALAVEPPSPALRPDDWRETWLQRLRRVSPFEPNWLAHSTRDDYWAHGSIRPDYHAIECPVFIAGGWADGYTDGAVRLAAGLPGPVRALIGPWAHTWPHTPGNVGPRVAFPELIAGWIHARENTGAQVWIEGASGGFHALAASRLEGDERLDWPLADPRYFADRTDASDELVLQSAEPVGSAGGSWCPFDASELADEQTPDDVRSATFTTEPLSEPLMIVGQARFRAPVETPGPALLCARLVAVDPNGTAHRIAWGVQRLVAGRSDLLLKLTRTAWEIPAGHRLRLSLSTAYWPIVWPEQRSAHALTVHVREAVMSIPVLPERPPRVTVPDAEPAAHDPVVDITAPAFSRQTTRRGDRHALTIRNGLTQSGKPAMRRLDPIGTEIGFGVTERHSITDGDPLSASSILATCFEVSEGGTRLSLAIRSRLTCDAADWRLQVRLVARADGRCIHAGRWDERIPRQG